MYRTIDGQRAEPEDLLSNLRVLGHFTTDIKMLPEPSGLDGSLLPLNFASFSVFSVGFTLNIYCLTLSCVLGVCLIPQPDCRLLHDKGLPQSSSVLL